MWRAEKEVINHRTHRYQVFAGSAPIDFAEAIAGWEDDQSFRSFFVQLLKDSEFAAFRWETPPVTMDILDRTFEFVLLRCDALQRPAEVQTFAAHFRSGKSDVTFANLGGDAVLIVPCPAPATNTTCYSDLASFVRGVGDQQIDSLWQSVAAAMRERVSNKPVWLSTAGMGVSWLHVRLDDRPKYYGYGTYRSSP